MKVGPPGKPSDCSVPNSKQQELLRYFGGVELTPHSGSSKLHVWAVCATFRHFSNTFRS